MRRTPMKLSTKAARWRGNRHDLVASGVANRAPRLRDTNAMASLSLRNPASKRRAVALQSVDRIFVVARPGPRVVRSARLGRSRQEINHLRDHGRSAFAVARLHGLAHAAKPSGSASQLSRSNEITSLNARDPHVCAKLKKWRSPVF
jgi:hypothetical protein